MIFLDSSYIIALINKKDKNYNGAIKLREFVFQDEMFINSVVLNKVLNVFKGENSLVNFNKVLNFILSDITLNSLTVADYLNSVDIFKNYGTSINFSDCTILYTMMNNNINNIVSFDSDFDKIKGINRIYL